MILAGSKLVATNIDPNCPTESGMRPGCGAIVAMLEAASGIKAFSVGKPSPLMLRGARKEMGMTTDQTVVIGDTMETDILGACNWATKPFWSSPAEPIGRSGQVRLSPRQNRQFDRQPRSRCAGR